MDKLKNLNFKSKSISMNPAQDRLQSLQKRLQTQQNIKGISAINSFIQESSNHIKIGNYHSIVKCPRNESKLEKDLKKTSSIQNRLNLLKKQTEKDSSEKPKNKSNEDNHKALKLKNCNNIEEKAKYNVNTNNHNNLEKNAQTKYSTVKNKINSVWESIKNVWNSNKDKSIEEYKKLENIKSETQNQDLLLKPKKFEEILNSNNVYDQKLFDNTNFSISNFKKDHNKHDKKNILEPLCTKYIRLRETPENNTSCKIQDNDVSMLELNKDSTQNRIKKRRNDRSLSSDKESSKKIKLTETNEDLFKNSNKLEIKKNSNLIIPSPNKKFSANRRLENLREQLKINQPKQQQLRGPQQPCSTVVESNINTENSTPPNFTNNNLSNEVDDNVFERFDVVNQNLANLVKNNNQKNEFKKDYLYIVPDTNVFLNNLSFLCDMIKSKLCDTKGSILYIPYIVLQELDKLKMKKNNSISVRASRAVNYLNENFESKNLHFKGQSGKESQKYLINIENSDDQIINCCLQLKSYNIKYILLSNDINLRNKAICNDIICSSKENLES